MAITYHAGRRIQGLSTENTVTTSLSLSELKAYYKFDESSGGSSVNSASTAGSSDSISSVNLSLTGVTFVTGKIGNAGYSDGSNNSALTGGASSNWKFINATGAEWTIITWVKMDNFSSLQNFLQTTNFGSGETGFLFQITTGRGIHFQCGTNGTDRMSTTTTTQLFPNDTSGWHMIMVKYSDTSGTLSISVDNGTPELLTGQNLTNNTNPEAYLHMFQSTGGANNLYGALDEVSIWNRVLTADEISGIYNGGTGIALNNAKSGYEPKPTDVQAGSRFEETDTRKMYHYTDPLILDEDFDYATQALADAKWVTNSTVARVNVSTDKLGFAWTSGATDQGCYYDLGSVSDTKWLLKFVINYTSETPSGYHPIHNFFVSSSNSSLVYPVSSAGIGYQYAVGGTDLYFKSTISSGGEVAPSAVSWNASANTDYYVEIKRTSATTAEMRVRTGSHSGTVVSTQLMTGINSACIGLRYLRLQQYLTGSFGAVSGTIDDIQFYNGSTSTSNYWSEEGT